MIKRSGRFWMRDDFVDKYARNLSPYVQVVFVALSRHAGPDFTTFVGCRTLQDELGIDKNTVSKSIKKLMAYGLVRRVGKKSSGAYILKIILVPFEGGMVYDRIIHKDSIKEYIKEDKNIKNKSYKGRERMMKALKENNPKEYNNLYSNSDKTAGSEYE